MVRTTSFALAAAVMFANAGLALGGATHAGETRATVAAANFVDARQFRVAEARVPGTSVRQSVIAWQVSAGTWNGQTLDGLSLVFVEQTSSGGRGARSMACYVSEYATPAQRDALLAALTSSQPQLRDIGSIRLEPAVVRIEIDGQTAVIHLALIS